MKSMVGLVIAVLLLFIVTLFWPSSSNDHDDKGSVPSISEENKVASSASGTEQVTVDESSEADDKAAQMKAEYEILEQERRELKRYLARLKHEIWGMKFPPEQAREINDIMLNAHKFEKTPRMLGAFLNVDDISAEIEKVRFAIKSLEELESTIGEQQSGE